MNNRSAEGYEDQVQKLFEEEAADGWMMETTDEQAKVELGEDLHMPALAVAVETKKIQVVQDRTHKVHVNSCIKVKDQTSSPPLPLLLLPPSSIYMYMYMCMYMYMYIYTYTYSYSCSYSYSYSCSYTQCRCGRDERNSRVHDRRVAGCH